MKITLTINGAEIVFEAVSQKEIESMGLLLKELVGVLPPGAKASSTDRQSRQTAADSELHRERAAVIDFTLSTSRFPMNAREIADQVKGADAFYTKNGDPVHIVRRVLASDERFEKTISGLFTLKDKLVQDAAKAVEVDPLISGVLAELDKDYSTVDDEMEDPFAEDYQGNLPYRGG